MPTETLPPPPRCSAGHAPLRLAGSVRRTSSLDVDWPDGRAEPIRLIGRARDVITPREGGDAVNRAEDSLEARLTADRTILSIACEPSRSGVARLVGQRGGGHLRKVLGDVLPEERRAGTPLYLLLDDISGTALVAGWAWSRWDPEWLETLRKRKVDPAFAEQMNKTGVCIGFAEGSSAIGTASDDGTATVDLRHPDDPQGWHAFPLNESVGLRRARRIDVSRNGLIRIDAAFQDSATTPGGVRAVLHEYRIMAAADPVSLKLVEIEAEPRVLPFPECPGAAANVSRLLGTPLPELREAVLEHLRGTAGCTHLNDALRALAEVPVLMGYLE